MTQPRAVETRYKLIQAGIDLIRKKGFAATSVDDICAESGVSKGAFFHHFANKQKLAEEALAAWDRGVAQLAASGPHNELSDPRERVIAFLRFFRGVLEDPDMIKSCPAGTTVQEIADTHPGLRLAANECFRSFERYLGGLLADAIPEQRRAELDPAHLAQLWMATMQGTLILYKASQDPGVVTRNLEQMEFYIAGLLAGDSTNQTRSSTGKP